MTRIHTDQAPFVGDVEELGLLDRCDRCGAQAKVRVTLASTLELLFCGNHYHKHAEAIRPDVVAIRDERDWAVEERPQAKEGAS